MIALPPWHSKNAPLLQLGALYIIQQTPLNIIDPECDWRRKKIPIDEIVMPTDIIKFWEFEQYYAYLFLHKSMKVEAHISKTTLLYGKHLVRIL